MNSTLSTGAGALVAAFLAAASSAAEAQSVRTITDVWGGSNNGAAGCAATFGPTPALGAFFNGGGFSAVGGNTHCGYSGSTSDQSAAAAPLTTSATLAPVPLGTSSNTYGSFGGQVSATASYQSLGVQATGTLTGEAANTDAKNASSAAFFDDVLTATGNGVSTGTAGFIRYTFEVEGSLHVLPEVQPYHTSFAAMVMNYQLNDGPIFGDVYLNAQSGAAPVLYAQDGDFNGFAVGAGSISGSGLFRTGLLAIEYGVPFSFRLGMLASVIGEGSVDFLHTGKIVDIELFDGALNALADVGLLGASGTDYFAPSVVTPVPEPETWTLMAASLAVLAWMRRRRAVT